MANDNVDSEGEAAAAAAVNPLFDATDGAENIQEKLDLITGSAQGGLDAKANWYKEKLQNFADEKLALFNKIDETCRIKLDDQKNTAKAQLEDAAATAMTTLRDCRMTYVESVLQKKEELKGQLQNLLNETIIRIKELKAGQELNEAGLPTDDHANVLEAEITAEVTGFNDALTTFVTDEFTNFFNAGPNAAFLSCKTAAETAFDSAYSLDNVDAGTQTGVFPELTTTYEECKTELETFQDKVE